MSPAFLIALPQLIAAGIATEQQIVGLIRSFSPGLTDAELNAILELLKTRAQAHKDLADKDARGAAPPPAMPPVVNP